MENCYGATWTGGVEIFKTNLWSCRASVVLLPIFKGSGCNAALHVMQLPLLFF